ncbi:hypothetical protein WA026_006686 [Henosepilachna vigintioctopunctata]|uniref:Uncharacterized protein n=1 Tax=Henosepilachna vigintioctopunctata TaxID=420089 RepID=A0AAW1UGF1_9CUCU
MGKINRIYVHAEGVARPISKITHADQMPSLSSLHLRQFLITHSPVECSNSKCREGIPADVIRINVISVYNHAKRNNNVATTKKQSMVQECSGYIEIIHRYYGTGETLAHKPIE